MAWTPSKEVIERAKKIHAILVKHGYSKNSSAGVLGNLIVETAHTLSPTINEFGGGGYGLGQWTPKENVYIQGSILGLSRSECDTLEGQAYIISQGDKVGQWLNSVGLAYPVPYRNPLTLSQFKTSGSKEQCVYDFMAHWERPSTVLHHVEWRIEAVKVIYPYLTGDGGGGSSGGEKICYTNPLPNTSLDKNSFGSCQLFGTHVGCGRQNNFHDGLDFGSIDHPGNNICAIANGVVTKVGNEIPGLRVHIVVNHGKYNVVYQEFSYNMGNAKVKVGDKVKAGQVIGIRDEDHLHLGITKKDFMVALGSSFIDDGTWIDPLTILGTCEDGGGVKPPDKKPEDDDDFTTHLLMLLGV